MDCVAASDWLMLADDPCRPTAEVAAHLLGCPSCQKLAAQLAGLEAAVHSYPTPAFVLTRRNAFLLRLAATPRRRSPLRRYAAVLTALAASLALGIALAAIFPTPHPAKRSETVVAQVAPPVVETLVEWNLRLTETQAPAEREKLVREELPKLQAAVRVTPLSNEDRDFAEKLLENGKHMGESTDPVDEAEGFHEMADSLLVRLDSAGNDADRSEFLAKMYAQVVDRGVDANLARADRQALKAEKQARVQNLKKAKRRQAARAAALAERIPEKARQHVRPNRPKNKGNRPAK